MKAASEIIVNQGFLGGSHVYKAQIIVNQSSSNANDYLDPTIALIAIAGGAVFSVVWAVEEVRGNNVR